MYKDSEIQYSTNDEGRQVAMLRISSSNLPMIHIDTYQTFTGDSAIEYELDYFYSECGLEDNVLQVDIESHKAVLENLAETSNSWLGDFLYFLETPAVSVGEVISTWSPAAYNFATDEYDAEYFIDLEYMEQWITANNWDYEEYGLETFKSYSGFYSHVPYYLQRGDMQTGVKLWLFVHAYLSDALGYDGVGYYSEQDSWFYTMLEAESELYFEQLTLSWDNYGVRRVVEQALIDAGVDEDTAYDKARWHDEPNFVPTHSNNLVQEFKAWLDTIVKHYTKTDEGKK